MNCELQHISYTDILSIHRTSGILTLCTLPAISKKKLEEAIELLELGNKSHLCPSKCVRDACAWGYGASLERIKRRRTEGCNGHK